MAVADREAYPFPVARVNPEMVAAYQVLIRSTKIVVDADGTIAYRWGYGIEPSGGWRALLESLVSAR
jgi:peroxiredoxin